jgi:hypothetical protein
MLLLDVFPDLSTTVHYSTGFETRTPAVLASSTESTFISSGVTRQRVKRKNTPVIVDVFWRGAWHLTQLCSPPARLRWIHAPQVSPLLYLSLLPRTYLTRTASSQLPLSSSLCLLLVSHIHWGVVNYGWPSSSYVKHGVTMHAFVGCLTITQPDSDQVRTTSYSSLSIPPCIPFSWAI